MPLFSFLWLRNHVWILSTSKVSLNPHAVTHADTFSVDHLLGCSVRSSCGRYWIVSYLPQYLRPRESRGLRTLYPCYRSPFVYYESMKRKLKIKPIYECRCDERLHPRTAEATGIFTTTDEFYFTTAEKKLLENCRCIVPNFNND